MNLFPRGVSLFTAIAAFVGAAWSSPAVSILSGPRFTEAAANAPLAGVLDLSTDGDSRVSVLVDDGATAWQRHFYDYGTSHSLPLLGFRPGRTNTITVTVRDRHANTATASPLTFITHPLPDDFPKIALLESKPEKMEPGYTLCKIVKSVSGTDYLTILNSSGEVVWYLSNSTNAMSIDVRQLENGNLFYPATNFVELNLLGETVKTLAPPPTLPIDFHDGVPTGHGTILYLTGATRTVTNFPTSTTDPNAPLADATVWYQQVVEISATNGTLLNTWSLLDMLDPDRIDYLALASADVWDAEHANAVIEDPKDDSIIVSLRNQDAVIKFSRATGQLKWILGPHENWAPEFQRYLLTPVGTPFQWNYGQHAPMLTPQGTLIVYDNGNFRASPFDALVPNESNYSRAVEFHIDEQKMEVSQVWEYGSQTNERLFTAFVGDADWLPQSRNVLVTFGAVSYVNGVHPSASAPGALMARIKEVTHDPVPEVVFDLVVFDYANTDPSFHGYWVYRSTRIPDLYSRTATAVADLTVRLENGRPRLEFSADATRIHFVEASTDLRHWEQIGKALLENSGDFTFEDDNSGAFPARYYRVVTQ